MGIPTPTKCFFCMPLKKGLLIMAYIKVITNLCGAAVLYPFETEDDMFGLPPIVVDTLFTLIYIISAHKNKPAGPRMYFYYMITSIIITIFKINVELFDSEAVYYNAGALSLISTIRHFLPVRKCFLFVLTYGTVDITLQVYWALLLRSQVHQLKKSSKTQLISDVQNHSECPTNV